MEWPKSTLEMARFAILSFGQDLLGVCGWGALWMSFRWQLWYWTSFPSGLILLYAASEGHYSIQIAQRYVSSNAFPCTVLAEIFQWSGSMHQNSGGPFSPWKLLARSMRLGVERFAESSYPQKYCRRKPFTNRAPRSNWPISSKWNVTKHPSL